MAKPFKYRVFVDGLDPDTIYSPASIVRHGEDAGLLDDLPEDELKITRRRIRHTLARLSTNRGFPYQGDGWYRLPGQAPLRGWFGWRWQEAIQVKDKHSSKKQSSYSGNSKNSDPA